ncbi:hypothetical protein A5718_08585 [Mycolicibacterium conceptionense]|nr:hypothetical protein A5718_08585 [Mycolicibacterium conceptionense]OBF38732.1 hypothetical protein A5720_18890 [Mycolicibacterium conceptionense]
MWVGKHRQLLQVGKFAQVDFLGQLSTNRTGQVLVDFQAATGKGPFALLGIQRPLPQQHVECGLPGVEAANLEHNGEHFVRGVTMWHVFDYKSKT